MEKGLVSIITPCYNGEKFIGRFLESILNQTYHKIELFVVDDGSTDLTAKIIDQYTKKMHEKGIVLKYIYQINAGQAAALNQALSVFNGEYLMWTDSDDILLPDNVSHKVNFLVNHKEYDYVMCYGQTVMDDNLNGKKEDFRRIPPSGTDNMFEDLILERNVIFTPGVYMVRSDIFFKSNPKRHIIESRVGQNFQMLLPLAYKYKCGYLREYLFEYVIRTDSHSRDAMTEEDMLCKYANHKELLIKVIMEIVDKDLDYYLNMIEKKYLFMTMNIAIMYQDKKLIKASYQTLKKNHMLDSRIRVRYYADKYSFINYAFEMLQKVKKAVRNKLR